MIIIKYPITETPKLSITKSLSPKHIIRQDTGKSPCCVHEVYVSLPRSSAL